MLYDFFQALTTFGLLPSAWLLAFRSRGWHLDIDVFLGSFDVQRAELVVVFGLVLIVALILELLNLLRLMYHLLLGSRC